MVLLSRIILTWTLVPQGTSLLEKQIESKDESRIFKGKPISKNAPPSKTIKLNFL